ncbi:MAG: glycerol-3-phosphate dehydrogenase/oxidase [Zetaproteobacteria bacterium]|nr:glycerol-3-phosphate dehydrogenase/oxidase [Zetaproteobacteria bacterium]
MDTVELPQSAEVVILGGGIHGVGILHDLLSRGVQNVVLFEKGDLGAGTSRKSTKLIHGGLRYLKRLSDFGLVREALRERELLLNIAPDLVQPVELLFPILRGGGERGWVVKIGLSLYDRLSGSQGISKHKYIPIQAALEKVPILETSQVKSVYSFWDGQTDDLALVHRVAASALKLGGNIFCGSSVEKLNHSERGWEVKIVRNGVIHCIYARYIVNALGPWSNQLLEQSGISVPFQAINNKGVHLILPDLGLKAGLFLQSPEDGRIFFLLPWLEKTLLGTTEELYTGDPSQVIANEQDVEYLLTKCNRYLSREIKPAQVEESFAGLRWLVVDRTGHISKTSREYQVGVTNKGKHQLLTLYGGKLTSYRALAEKIGDRVAQYLGVQCPSRTTDPQMWVKNNTSLPHLSSLKARFKA